MNAATEPLAHRIAGPGRTLFCDACGGDLAAGHNPGCPTQKPEPRGVALMRYQRKLATDRDGAR